LRIRESIHATLKSAHLPGRDWGPDQLINFVADFLTTHVCLAAARPNPVHRNAEMPLRSQLSDLEIASRVGDGNIRFRKAGGEGAGTAAVFGTSVSALLRL